MNDDFLRVNDDLLKQIEQWGVKILATTGAAEITSRIGLHNGMVITIGYGPQKDEEDEDE